MALAGSPAVAGLQACAWALQHAPTPNFPELLTDNLVKLQSMVLQEHQCWQQQLRTLQAERQDVAEQQSVIDISGVDKGPLDEDCHAAHASPVSSPRPANMISCSQPSEDFTAVLPFHLQQHSQGVQQPPKSKDFQVVSVPQAPAHSPVQKCLPPLEDCAVLPFHPEHVQSQGQADELNTYEKIEDPVELRARATAAFQATHHRAAPSQAKDSGPKAEDRGAGTDARLQQGLQQVRPVFSLAEKEEHPQLARESAPSMTLAIPMPREESVSISSSARKQASFLLPGSAVAVAAGSGDESDQQKESVRENGSEKAMRVTNTIQRASAYQDGSVHVPQLRFDPYTMSMEAGNIRGSWNYMDPMAQSQSGSCRTASSFYPSQKRDSTESDFLTVNCFDMHPCWIARPMMQTAATCAKLPGPGTQPNQLTRSDQLEEEFLDDEVIYDHDRRWSEFLSHHVVITPGSACRLTWDIFGFLLVSYDSIVIPLMFFDPPQSVAATVVLWFSRIFWSIDMGMTFITGYQTPDGHLETRLNKIAWHYLGTWFMLDAVIITFDWMELVASGGQTSAGASGRMTKFMRIMRVLRTLRMLRVVRVLYMHSGEMSGKISLCIRSEEVMIIAGIVKLVTIVTGMIHIVACCWYGVGKGDGHWVEFYELENASLGYRYACSFHWALTQFIGSADILPQNHRERSFAVAVLMVAFVTSGVVVSSITTLMTRLQIVTAHSSKQLTMLRRYLIENNISSSLAGRVQRNAKHIIAEQKKNITESSVELLAMISTPLVVEIHYECHGSVLMWHPFFKSYHVLNAPAFRHLCHVGVSRLRLSKGDVAISPGEVPQHPRMLYILDGKMRYMRENHRPVRLEQQCWACEPHLWIIGWTHHGELRAETDCAISALDAEQFRQTGLQFRSAEFFPAKYAAVYVKKMNMSNDVSDLNNEAVDASEVAQQAFPEKFFRKTGRFTHAPSLGFIGRVGTAISGLSRTTTLATLPTEGNRFNTMRQSMQSRVMGTLRGSMRGSERPSARASQAGDPQAAVLPNASLEK